MANPLLVKETHPELRSVQPAVEISKPRGKANSMHAHHREPLGFFLACCWDPVPASRLFPPLRQQPSSATFTRLPAITSPDLQTCFLGFRQEVPANYFPIYDLGRMDFNYTIICAQRLTLQADGIP